MVKFIPPTFIRIYLSMIVAIVVSIIVTVVMVSYYLEKEEIDLFVKETNYLHNKLNLELETSQISAETYFIVQPRYLNGYELNWIEEDNGQEPCSNCEYISKVKGVDLYWEYPEDELIAVYNLEPHSGRLVISLPQPSVPELFAENSDEVWFDDSEDAAVYLLLFIILAVIGCVLYYPAMKLQKQIEKLNQTYIEFGKGDLTARAQEDIPQPIKQLAVNFNYMAEEISETVKESQVFAQAVPHEMRTPLSRIQLAAGILRKSTDNDMHIELLNNIDTYIDDLDSLTRQVVTYSKLNSTSAIGDESHIENIELCEYIASRTNILSEGTDKAVRLNTKQNYTISCHAVHVRLLLDNLIKNALHYANSEIQLSVIHKENQVLVVVEDDGLGIPEEKYQTIFIPFSRLDKSRNQKTGGLGLGLAIAKNAAIKLNGTLLVGRSDLGGAKFIFSITKE